MSPRLAFALETAYRAGRLTLGYFNAGAEVKLKSDDSPVTEADRQAERLMRSAIQKRYPGEAILGEEEGLTGSGEARWVIDPIDGTKSFVCGVPLFGTLLCFEESEAPVLAVAYFPAVDDLVFAERGHGAFWNGRPCKVSDKSRLEDAVLSCGSHAAFRSSGRERAFGSLVERAHATRTWSDAYGHALVATGRVEAMVDPIVAYWDIAGMRLIVREAGGICTNLSGDGEPITEALSSNAVLHEAILEAFRF